MTPTRRFLFASLGGSILLATAITSTVRAELSMVTPDGRTYVCRQIRYATAARTVVCDEADLFNDSFEGK